MRLTFSPKCNIQYVIYQNITLRYLFVSQCPQLWSLDTFGLNWPYWIIKAGTSMAKNEVNLSFIEYLTSQSHVNLENYKYNKILNIISTTGYMILYGEVNNQMLNTDFEYNYWYCPNTKLTSKYRSNKCSAFNSWSWCSYRCILVPISLLTVNLRHHKLKINEVNRAMRK